MRTCVAFGFVAFLLAYDAAGALQHSESVSVEQVVQQFQESVANYVAVKAAAVEGLPSPEISRDIQKIRGRVEARHRAIAAARATAKEGELFSEVASRVFRARIREILELHGLNEVQALAIIEDEVLFGPVPLIVVNGYFPWDFGSVMIPCVLEALPALPLGLQYRFVHNSLVLLDIDADLIVDILPNAVPEGIYA